MTAVHHHDYRSRLIAARERLGLSRLQMAARLWTPHATYQQWESGQRRTPGIAVIAAEGLLCQPASALLRPSGITGHPRGHRAEIEQRLRGGEAQADIARSLGVSGERVRQIGAEIGITGRRTTRGESERAAARAAAEQQRVAARAAVATSHVDNYRTIVAAVRAAMSTGLPLMSACRLVGRRHATAPMTVYGIVRRTDPGLRQRAWAPRPRRREAGAPGESHTG